MANIGRQLVRGLGAAMQGYGAGMIAQAQVDERKRQEDVQMQREAALLELRHQYSERSADSESARMMKRAERGAEIAVGQEAATLRVREPYREAEDERRAIAAAAAEERAQQNRVALARLTSSLDMNEAAQRAAIELSNALALAGQTVERFETSTDGRVVAFNGRGQMLNQTAAGVVAPDVPRGGGTATLSIPRRGEGGSGGSAATPPATRTIRYDAEGRRIGG